VRILSHLRLRTKLALLLAMSALALVVSIVAGASLTRQRMTDDRVDKLRAVVQSAMGFAQALNKQVVTGRLTQPQALAEFRDDLHIMRFDSGANYILVQTPDGIVVMHGGDPAREGRPTASKDADGRSSADLAREALGRTDEGVITYLATKPGMTQATPKLSYVARFAPWQMVFIAGDWTDDLDAAYDIMLLRLAVVGGAILLAMLLAAWLISRDISGSLSKLKKAMELLATGELSTDIPGTSRGDEVGDMADTVEVFKGYMVKERLAAAQEHERQQIAVAKHAALLAMVDQIEAETTTSINQVGTRTAAMTETAEQMSASAARTGNSAQAASNASAQALANAQAVASAAEELSASIHEINGQMAQSTEIVGRAVAAGAETRASIEALNDQVGRIGEVAGMIGEIAARTNLLALNATIEAARAGEAGKGFAVVASEVKSLATQTARFTAEIAQHISQVRSATGVSVAAVVRIEQTINEIDAIATSIAAAVEEQGAATAEIARNVAETASAADAVTDRVSEVSAEATQTGRRAAEVCTDAAGLNAAVGDLRHAVIRVVRTSTTEMDRRRAVRHQVDLPCRLSIPGRTSRSARITDLSEGGARISAVPLLPLGARGDLHLDSIGFPLPFVVRSVDDDSLRVMFELDEVKAAKVETIAERLSLSHAA
jgi:methyl-accepting chemotaxis protein